MLAETQQQNILKIRVDVETLSLLEQARGYLELDKSKFIRQSIREKAQTIISEHQKTHFNEADWQLFFALIDNPPPPTERIKKAALTYQAIMDSNEV